jgi:O-acetylserine/cysteine efflux transporter
VTVLIWSANFVVVKAAIGVLGPLTFTAARFGLAAATLFVLVRLRDGTIRPQGHLGPRLMALGVLGFGCYQVLWTAGLAKVTAGDSALIIAASPVITALLAGLAGMDRLTAPKLAGALLAFAGVAIVVIAGHGVALGASLAGDVLTLGAAALWAVYTVIGARVLRHIDPLQATAWAVLGGFLFLLPFGAWDVANRPPPDLTPAVLAGLAYSGMLAAGVASVLMLNAVRFVGPTRASAMQLLVPAGAVVLGAVFLGESVGIAQVVGGIVIVLGVVLTRRARLIPLGLRARARTA